MQDVLQVLFKLTCIAATGSSEHPAGGSAVMQQKKSNIAYVFTKCLECVRTVTGLAQDSGTRFKKKRKERRNITTTTNTGYYYYHIISHYNHMSNLIKLILQINVVYYIQVFKIQKQERSQRFLSGTGAHSRKFSSCKAELSTVKHPSAPRAIFHLQ